MIDGIGLACRNLSLKCVQDDRCVLLAIAGNSAATVTATRLSRPGRAKKAGGTAIVTVPTLVVSVRSRVA